MTARVNDSAKVPEGEESLFTSGLGQDSKGKNVGSTDGTLRTPYQVLPSKPGR